MKPINVMKLQLDSLSMNEGFARVAVSAFAALLDPTLEELNDIKTAVSEAVTNCIVHGYRDERGKIYIRTRIFENQTIEVQIRDKGRGIADVEQAKQPLFTTLGGDRAGLGFSVMESFTDKMRVRSTVGKGTTVTLLKRIEGKNRAEQK